LAKSNRSVYIRCHTSTSGNAQLVAKRARPKSMENSSLHGDNKPRKSYYFSTETLISGHKYCDRLQPTPYFHFRLGAKCRQTCTAWVNGKNSYDHWTLTTVHSLVFALKRWISGQKQSFCLHPTPYLYFRWRAVSRQTCTVKVNGEFFFSSRQQAT